MLVDVEGYMTPLEVPVPRDVQPGAKFAVNVSRGTMDDLEAAGVGQAINVAEFDHVGPLAPGFASEHPLRALVRVGLFHLTQGKVRIAMPQLNTRSPKEVLAKLRLLIRCRVLAKRWRRRTKQNWRATAAERAKKEAERAAHALAHPVLLRCSIPAPKLEPVADRENAGTGTIADASAVVTEDTPDMPLRGKGRTSIPKAFALDSLADDDVKANADASAPLVGGATKAPTPTGGEGSVGADMAANADASNIEAAANAPLISFANAGGEADQGDKGLHLRGASGKCFKTTGIALHANPSHSLTRSP